jgi:hypothetical protein
MSEQKIIKCPFCDQGDITTLHTPGMMVTKYGRASSNKKAITYYKDEKYEILVDKCPNCSKSKKEIEKALKHGKELPNEEVLKRLREAGLDPSKLK